MNVMQEKLLLIIHLKYARNLLHLCIKNFNYKHDGQQITL